MSSQESEFASYTDIEIDLFLLINKSRQDPQSLIPLLRETIPRFEGKVYQPKSGDEHYITQEGVSVVYEAIDHIRKLDPLPAFKFSRGLYMAAKGHVRDIGTQGTASHQGTDGRSLSQRVDEYGQWRVLIAENIAFNDRIAEDILLNFVLDDGNENRGHRENIFNPSLEVIGIACGAHREFGHCCVVNFSGEMYELDGQEDLDEDCREVLAMLREYVGEAGINHNLYDGNELEDFSETEDSNQNLAQNSHQNSKQSKSNQSETRRLESLTSNGIKLPSEEQIVKETIPSPDQFHNMDHKEFDSFKFKPDHLKKDSKRVDFKQIKLDEDRFKQYKEVNIPKFKGKEKRQTAEEILIASKDLSEQEMSSAPVPHEQVISQPYLAEYPLGSRSIGKQFESDRQKLLEDQAIDIYPIRKSIESLKLSKTKTESKIKDKTDIYKRLLDDSIQKMPIKRKMIDKIIIKNKKREKQNSEHKKFHQGNSLFESAENLTEKLSRMNQRLDKYLASKVKPEYRSFKKRKQTKNSEVISIKRNGYINSTYKEIGLNSKWMRKNKSPSELQRANKLEQKPEKDPQPILEEQPEIILEIGEEDINDQNSENEIEAPKIMQPKPTKSDREFRDVKVLGINQTKNSNYEELSLKHQVQAKMNSRIMSGFVSKEYGYNSEFDKSAGLTLNHQPSVDLVIWGNKVKEDDLLSMKKKSQYEVMKIRSPPSQKMTERIPSQYKPSIGKFRVKPKTYLSKSIMHMKGYNRTDSDSEASDKESESQKDIHWRKSCSKSVPIQIKPSSRLFDFEKEKQRVQNEHLLKKQKEIENNLKLKEKENQFNSEKIKDFLLDLENMNGRLESHMKKKNQEKREKREKRKKLKEVKELVVKEAQTPSISVKETKLERISSIDHLDKQLETHSDKKVIKVRKRKKLTLPKEMHEMVRQTDKPSNFPKKSAPFPRINKGLKSDPIYKEEVKEFIQHNFQDQETETEICIQRSDSEHQDSYEEEIILVEEQNQEIQFSEKEETEQEEIEYVEAIPTHIEEIAKDIQNEEHIEESEKNLIKEIQNEEHIQESGKNLTKESISKNSNSESDEDIIIFETDQSRSDMEQPTQIIEEVKEEQENYSKVESQQSEKQNVNKAPKYTLAIETTPILAFDKHKFSGKVSPTKESFEIKNTINFIRNSRPIAKEKSKPEKVNYSKVAKRKVIIEEIIEIPKPVKRKKVTKLIPKIRKQDPEDFENSFEINNISGTEIDYLNTHDQKREILRQLKELEQTRKMMQGMVGMSKKNKKERLSKEYKRTLKNDNSRKVLKSRRSERSRSRKSQQTKSKNKTYYKNERDPELKSANRPDHQIYKEVGQEEEPLRDKVKNFYNKYYGNDYYMSGKRSNRNSHRDSNSDKKKSKSRNSKKSNRSSNRIKRGNSSKYPSFK